MTKVIKEIEIDVAHQHSGTTIIAKQGDMNSRFLRITITNNKVPVIIDQSALVTMNVLRMDGASKVFQGQINKNGKVDIELNGWILELSGIVKCDISIIKDSSKLTSFDFFIDVATSACPMTEISNSDNYDILEGLISRVEKLSNNKRDIIEGYYNKVTGLFYEDEQFRKIINGATNILYIDLQTDSSYRYDKDKGFVRISSSVEIGDYSDEVYILNDDESEEDIPEDAVIVICPDDHPEVIDWTSYYTKKEINEIIIRADFKKGKSAYEIAVEQGFEGNEVEWLESIKGKNAYELAIELGLFEGTVAEWYKSLKGAPFVFADFTAEQLDLLRFKFEHFTEEQLALLKGEAFKYEDFTQEQLEALKFRFEDFAEAELKLLKGEPFRYEDFTQEQLDLITPKKGTHYWTSSEVKEVEDKIASSAQNYIEYKMAELVGSAPEELDTLEKLAIAFEEHEDLAEGVLSTVGQKVDKVDGKGLSTNDYTDKDKEKLTKLSERITLQGRPAIAGYYLFGTLPKKTDSGNYASFILNGRFGGWEVGNSSFMQIMLLNRNGVSGTVSMASTASNLNQVWDVFDIVISENPETEVASIYLKCTNYFLYDFEWMTFNGTYLYTGTPITEAPTNIVWQLSTAPKMMLSSTGVLYANGKELITKEEVQAMFTQFANEYFGEMNGYKLRVANDGGKTGYITVKKG